MSEKERRNKLRVLGYGRVSTRGQFLKGTSAKDQKASVKKECKAKGWEYVGFISDDGVSGKTVLDRPAIVKIIELAKANKFDILVFKKLDRAGRNLRELENFWKLMEKDLGCQLYCIDEPQINGKMGKMLRQFLGIFSEFEREMILVRTKTGQLSKWQDGKAPVGLLPYAYEWDKEKKQIIVNREEKENYERIVSKYLDEHYCSADIALWLTEQGIPNRLQKRSKRWNGSTVLSTLKNPAYKGEPVIYNRYDKKGNEKPKNEWVKVTYDKLISSDRWNLIQERIKLNKKVGQKKHHGYYDRFICNDVLWCFYDGARVRKHLGSDGRKKYPYYKCGTNMRTKKDLKMKGREPCILNSVDADAIDERVWFEVVEFLSDPNQYIKEWLKDPDREEIEANYNRTKKQAEDLTKMIQRNTKEYFYFTGESRKQMKVQIKQAEEELESKQHKLDELQNEMEFYDKKEDKLKEFEKTISNFRASPNLKDRSKEMDYRNSYRSKILNHLSSLPVKDKKRIIEAVVKPEAGGKIKVRYLHGDDVVENEDWDKYTKEQLARPLKNRGPILEFDFKFDVNGIIALISSLKDSNLLKQTNQSDIRLSGLP